jgi:hypothetical protein
MNVGLSPAIAEHGTYIGLGLAGRLMFSHGFPKFGRVGR